MLTDIKPAPFGKVRLLSLRVGNDIGAADDVDHARQRCARSAAMLGLLSVRVPDTGAACVGDFNHGLLPQKIRTSNSALQLLVIAPLPVAVPPPAAGDH